MKTPDTIDDPELGALAYNSQLNWYEVCRDTKDGEVRISLSCDEFSDLTDLVDELRSFSRKVEKVMEDAYADIASTMVHLKNESWLQDGEVPFSEERFMSSIRGRGASISMDKGGLAEMFFDDGGVFGGHSIVVWHDEDGTCSGAHLAG